MRNRRIFALAALVAAGVGAAGLLLPHSPTGLRELVAAAGPAAPLIAIAAWTLLTPRPFPAPCSPPPAGSRSERPPGHCWAAWC